MDPVWSSRSSPWVLNGVGVAVGVGAWVRAGVTVDCTRVTVVGGTCDSVRVGLACVGVVVDWSVVKLAGYDASRTPMTRLCRGYCLHWPLTGQIIDVSNSRFRNRSIDFGVTSRETGLGRALGQLS
jgi:hypothetical protein